MFSKLHKTIVLSLVILSLLITGCSSATPTADPNTTDAPATGGEVKLVLAAYTTPREAYGEIIPAFQKYWKDKTGQTVTFEESYLGSGAQSRAVFEGFEADVVALSLQADITRIEKAGLITHDWTSAPNKGMVSTSVVAFAVRKGNPLGIHDWADLVKPDLEILTPNPKTSGGAQWNILALYGSLLQGKVAGIPANDPEAAHAFVVNLLKNVTVMDKGARESITNFEQGVGDLAITYENEVLVGQQAGQDYELVIPSSTILIENPVAVVDTYADKHGTREVAEAFINFLFTPEAQEIFAQHGLRSIDPGVAEATADQYPPVAGLFTIEFFGGWSKATPEYFGEEGLFIKAMLESQVPTTE